MKLDPQGNKLWVRTAVSNSYSNVDSIEIDELGNVYTAGTFFDNSINFGNGIITLPVAEGYMFVSKYTSAGTPQWVKTGGPLNANLRMLIECISENDIILAGDFHHPQIQLGTHTLTRVGSTANNFVSRLSTSLLDVNQSEINLVSIYPNPTSDILNVSGLNASHAYELFDFSGKSILKGSVNQVEHTINLNQIAAGIYILNIKDGENRKCLKVMKE